jgi:hypothetical protein
MLWMYFGLSVLTSCVDLPAILLSSYSLAFPKSKLSNTIVPAAVTSVLYTILYSTSSTFGTS